MDFKTGWSHDLGAFSLPPRVNLLVPAKMSRDSDERFFVICQMNRNHFQAHWLSGVIPVVHGRVAETPNPRCTTNSRPSTRM